QSPNFHGVIEDLDAAGAVARSAGALLEVVISDPHSLGLLKGPGRFGADLVVGEAHALGMPMSFGGPFLGFMAAKQSHVRQMPGRLVGEARDAQGRRGFVLTLSTREQHIRREKATSNICTNQGLIAMAATIYMSLMGREGMREAALQCHHKASHAARLLSEVPGCRRRFSAPFFHEFVIDLPVDADKTSADLLDRGIIGGLPLGRYDRDMSRSMLFCVTEMNTREEIERLAATLTEVTR
ncbi:MAG TPA: glycine dehydrogenase, partial [Candidatus Polarisedimenticolia bacterium]|nr:glycine dehydrogenase [Candidatus Polarisedimenticolia bacterium]